MRAAKRYMVSRQVQKLSSGWVWRSASPAIARWNACECRLGIPGTRHRPCGVCDNSADGLAGGADMRIPDCRKANCVRLTRRRSPDTPVKLLWFLPLLLLLVFLGRAL